MLTNRIRPKTNASSYFLAATLLTLGASACAGQLDVSEEPDPAAEDGSGGDGSGGTGSGDTTTASASSSSSSGSQATSSSGSGGGVSTTHCFAPPRGVDAQSVCAPTCEVQPSELRGTACPDSIIGGEGICAPFLESLPSQNGYTPAGVCSVSCDPLAPDCPENFACSLTEGGAGEPIPLIFACLPVLEARPVGSECDGWPTGRCAAGSECTQEAEGSTCRAYCDTGEDDACPESQTCEKPEWFPEASPAGVCQD